jgi:putative DNA primase/helicase
MAADPRRRASSTDARSWGCFDDACDALSCPTLRLDGIGYVLTVEDGIVCVDLDHVIDAQGQLDPLAAQIVAHCQSWTEISPSGTGLHTFVEGIIPAAIRGHQIEVYAEARYIAMTRVQWPGTPDDIQPAQASLDRLVARVLADRVPSGRSARSVASRLIPRPSPSSIASARSWNWRTALTARPPCFSGSAPW